MSLYVRNPVTRRKIIVNGKTHKKLVKEGYKDFEPVMVKKKLKPLEQAKHLIDSKLSTLDHLDDLSRRERKFFTLIFKELGKEIPKSSKIRKKVFKKEIVDKIVPKTDIETEQESEIEDIESVQEEDETEIEQIPTETEEEIEAIPE